MYRLLFYLFLCISITTTAQQTAQSYVQKTNYLLYLPDGYAKDTTKRWPLLLFLHGSGESGSDVEKVKANGPPKYINEGKQYPFIVVSPQAANFGWQTELLYQLLQDVKHQYRVDPNRVYLTGLSMGGFGSWDLAMKHPEEFAAVVPVCGGGDTTEVWKLRFTPVWAFHGAKDNVVPLSAGEAMIRALKRYNSSARLTIYPETGHDSWVQAYTTDSLYNWLLNQKKFSYHKIAFTQDQLKPFEGIYVQGKDSVRIRAGEGSLLADTGGGTETLYPASSNLFFIHEDRPFDVEFIRDEKGVVRKFIFRGNRRAEFEKLK
jgi:pimeloyl-ACP methyl ester carboxylesterase